MSRFIVVSCLAPILACSAGGQERVGEAGASFGEPDPSDTDGSGKADMLPDPDEPVCNQGSEMACNCPGGLQGVKACKTDGSGYDRCECPDGPAPGSCGDLVCDENETCESCPSDCGECLACTAAPNCEGALIPPIIDTHAEGLDNIQLNYVSPAEALLRVKGAIERAEPGARILAAVLSPAESDEHPMVARLRVIFANRPATTEKVREHLASAGLAEPPAYRALHPEPRSPTSMTVSGRTLGADESPCANPRMRVRVVRLDVFEEDDDFLNDEVYCTIASEGAESAELRVTPITPPLDEGDWIDYTLDEGLVWGQKEMSAPRGNLNLTYSCVESDTANGYADLLDAIGEAAGDAEGIPGLDGWVFDNVDVFAGLLSDVLALDGDDKLFSASQVISQELLLNLTGGAYWQVRRSGTHLNSDWDWALRMEIWGCHDRGY